MCCKTSVELVVVAHCEGHPTGPNRRCHALTAGIRRRHRFFTQHVLPSLHRGNHLRLVHRIRSGDNHRIHLRAPQQGIEIVIHLWNAMLLGKGSAAGFVTAQNRHQAPHRLRARQARRHAGQYRPCPTAQYQAS